MNPDFEAPLDEIRAKIEELKKQNADPTVPLDPRISELERELRVKTEEIYRELTPWQVVQVARHSERPVFQDYQAAIFTEFIELHGDRLFGDDRAIVGGFAMIEGHRVMLIGQSKGKTTEEKIKCNFGMARPEGYRKALRLMKLAEKYRLPIVCFIDTPAAYPGKDAEERGQAEAIARNLTEMIAMDTPIIAVVVGEGGSGGAIGVGVADVVLMLSNAIYSVIPPEGCAAILWRDAAKAPEAAEALKLTAPSLLKLKVIDEILAEPVGGAHRDAKATLEKVKEALVRYLRQYRRPPRNLLDRRIEKYARIGRPR